MEVTFEKNEALDYFLWLSAIKIQKSRPISRDRLILQEVQES